MSGPSRMATQLPLHGLKRIATANPDIPAAELRKQVRIANKPQTGNVRFCRRDAYYRLSTHHIKTGIRP